MNKRISISSGITLIALIITIIVLLILAIVTLNFVLGDSSIIQKASIAKQKTNSSQDTEKKQLINLENKIDKYSNSSRSDSTSNLGNRLLEETTLEVGKTYDLNDSIYNYNIIKLFVGVDIQNTSCINTAWGNNEIIAKTIRLNKENSYTSNFDFYPLTIASDSSDYRTPHFYFTKNNQIYCYAITGTGWPDCLGYKLIILGQ